MTSVKTLEQQKVSQPNISSKKAGISETNINDLPQEIQFEIDELKSLLDSFDFDQMGAPFLPNTFQVARKRFYHKIEAILENLPFDQKQILKLKTLNLVDKELFPKFSERIRAPYKTLVWNKKYKVPISVNVNDLKNLDALKEYQALCYNVAEWFLQTEISGDLMARGELYGFYTPKNKLKLTEIEQNFVSEKKSFDIIPRKIADMVVNNVVHIFSGVLTPSQESKSDSKLSKISSLAETVFGSEKIPWALLASGTSIAYIAGGYMFTKVLSLARKNMSRAHKYEEIAKLNHLTQNMIEFVKPFNEELEKILDCCLRAPSEKDLEQNMWDLEKKINQLIEYLTSGKIMENYQLLTEKNLSLKMLTSKESKDGWVVFDMEELEEKHGEEDFVVFDFKKQ